MNATGRVQRPSRRRGPPIVSRTPAHQICERTVTGGAPAGMCIGQPKSFIAPEIRKIQAVTMRSRARMYGAGGCQGWVTVLRDIVPPVKGVECRVASVGERVHASYSTGGAAFDPHNPIPNTPHRPI